MVEQHSDDYEKVMEDGPKYVRDDSNDLQTQSLRQQMQDVKDGWQQLHVLWESRKEQLEQSMNFQVLYLKKIPLADLLVYTFIIVYHCRQLHNNAFVTIV